MVFGDPFTGLNLFVWFDNETIRNDKYICKDLRREILNE